MEVPVESIALRTLLVLFGCHKREINAAPAKAPIRESESLREPSSRRDRNVLATAYLTREPLPGCPDRRYR
jgi:hypothetical protein